MVLAAASQDRSGTLVGLLADHAGTCLVFFFFFSLARSVGSHNELLMEWLVFEGSWCAIVGAGSNNRGACTERCEFARTQPRNYNQSPLLRL